MSRRQRDLRGSRPLVSQLRSAAILLGMAAVLGLTGAVLGGVAGLLLALVFATGLTLLGPRVSAAWMLHRSGARPLRPSEVPGLGEDLRELSARAGIPTPTPVLLPSPAPNAMTTGEGREVVVGLSWGLLRLLSRRERRAVLAHELAHVASGDIRVMRVAGITQSLTRSMSRFGLLLAFFQLPLVLLGAPTVPFVILAWLIAAPLASGALNLALSRSREFDADLLAAELTGDPEGLARALLTLEAAERHALRWLPFAPPQVPEWLRSHPLTAQRVNRLRALRQEALRREALGRQPISEAPRRIWEAVHQPRTRRVGAHRRPPIAVVRRPRGFFELRLH